MSVEPERAEASSAAQHVAETMIRLWQQTHEDVAPTISEEQMRVLLALGSEPTDPGWIARNLRVSASWSTCVLEATRQRRRQLLEQTVVTATPPDRPVLRDAFNQLYGAASPLARVPCSRSPL
ncbi:hypothetical protein ABZ484_17145 [Streptomyces sp. NPDC006393]|uniref:hypothetical protein n=1 Tax=Streptomyces sp. NPDC006393 TaxID=3156763 RepID=UPI0033CDD4BA